MQVILIFGGRKLPNKNNIHSFKWRFQFEIQKKTKLI